MARIFEDIPAPVPPAVAFAFLADFTNTAGWDPQIAAARRVGDGPVGLGTAFEVYLLLGSRIVPMTYTITELTPDARVVFTTRGSWFRGQDVVTVRPDDAGGSVVTWDATFALRGPLALLDPLLAVGFRRVAAAAVAGLGTALRGLA